MDDTFEKTPGFSFFVGVSVVAHLVGLFLILIINPSPTKAKFQKSTVRVGVKYSPKRVVIQPPSAASTPKKVTQPVLASEKKTPPPATETKNIKKAKPAKKKATPPEKKVSAPAKQKVASKPKVVKAKPPKKPAIPSQAVLTKPIYVPKKIKPTNPSELNLKPTLKKKTEPAFKPSSKALAAPVPKLELPKTAIQAPTLTPALKPKLSAKVRPLSLPRQLPKPQLPKLSKAIQKPPTMPKRPLKIPTVSKNLKQPSALAIPKSSVPLAPKLTQKSDPAEQVPIPLAPPLKEEEMNMQVEAPQLPKLSESKAGIKAREIPLPAKIQAQQNPETPKPPPVVLAPEKETDVIEKDVVVPPQPIPLLKPPSVVPPAQGDPVLRSSFQLRQQRERYNALIAVAIKENLYAPERYQALTVRIEVVIGLKGELIRYTLQNSSGVEAFDLTALNAVKTAQFPTLPEALLKNPPYVVVLEISP